MSQQINDGFFNNSPKPLDAKYTKTLSGLSVSYTNVAEVNSTIISEYRYQGLTVLIGTQEYWYRDGILDSNLILKIPAALTANNGININSNIIRLGGGLTQATTISSNAANQFPFSIVHDLSPGVNVQSSSYYQNQSKIELLHNAAGTSSQYGLLLQDQNITLSESNSGSLNSLIFADGVITITDQRFLKGVIYGGDYESNFTQRSLVTKQYVDALLASPIGASNGLSLSGNNIILGGNLTTLTTLNLNNNPLYTIGTNAGDISIENVIISPTQNDYWIRSSVTSGSTDDGTFFGTRALQAYNGFSYFYGDIANFTSYVSYELGTSGISFQTVGPDYANIAFQASGALTFSSVSMAIASPTITLSTALPVYDINTPGLQVLLVQPEDSSYYVGTIDIQELIGGGSSYTFENGLSQNNNIISLGGEVFTGNSLYMNGNNNTISNILFEDNGTYAVLRQNATIFNGTTDIGGQVVLDPFRLYLTYGDVYTTADDLNSITINDSNIKLHSQSPGSTLLSNFIVSPSAFNFASVNTGDSSQGLISVNALLGTGITMTTGVTDGSGSYTHFDFGISQGTSITEYVGLNAMSQIAMNKQGLFRVNTRNFETDEVVTFEMNFTTGTIIFENTDTIWKKDIIDVSQQSIDDGTYRVLAIESGAGGYNYLRKIDPSIFGGGSSYTFTNGITNTLGTVSLGGTMTTNTSLIRSLNGYNINQTFGDYLSSIPLYTVEAIQESDNSVINSFSSTPLSIGMTFGDFRRIDGVFNTVSIAPDAIQISANLTPTSRVNIYSASALTLYAGNNSTDNGIILNGPTSAGTTTGIAIQSTNEILLLGNIPDYGLANQFNLVGLDDTTGRVVSVNKTVLIKYAIVDTYADMLTNFNQFVSDGYPNEFTFYVTADENSGGVKTAYRYVPTFTTTPAKISITF